MNDIESPKVEEVINEVRARHKAHIATKKKVQEKGITPQSTPTYTSQTGTYSFGNGSQYDRKAWREMIDCD